MSLIVFVKENVNINSPFIGKALSLIPFGSRPGIGSVYQKRRSDIATYESLDMEGKRAFIFQRFRSILNYAYERVPFYKTFYDEKRFSPRDRQSFDDIKQVPVVSKEILKLYSVEDRTAYVKDKYLVNTDRSSGKPLSFYVSAKVIANEWAHMHRIWQCLGYKPGSLKLTFAGKSECRKNCVEYDALRHRYAVNIYADPALCATELKKILRKQRIEFLHGYTSALYEFSLYCRDHDHELIGLLKKNLKGALLSAEYPTPLFRDTIEKVFNIPSISWYGRTERSILAYESAKYVYTPFQTYGYTEALDNGSNKGVQNLVGTSFYNLASPLIRYDTCDEIGEVKTDDGILQSFSIAGKRAGDFILDAKQKKIPLTGLIFGRHHRLLDVCSHLQIAQQAPGQATILYVLSDTIQDLQHPEKLFDNSNVDIQFEFRLIDRPIKTISGKVNLLVNATEVTN
ncbi:hypothetical protein [Chitinophaga sp.]|uniref:hypothetical protein n=1 Tax=Chitinophaga sp. TaxID=1869181 RepID=UPI002F958BE7